ncbi:MAG: hypothetical protein NTX28_07565 [Novosphingobium sp.]|nr:hypothetical protein [Novosphingobium sp.]
MSLIPTWPIAAGALVVGLVVGGTGAKLWYAGTVADLKVEIANIKKDNAEAISQASQVALSDYKAGADLIKAAALSAQTDLSSVSAQLAAIRRNQKNAPPPPLPTDCKPGSVRLRNLSETAAAADQAIARSVPGK